MESGELRVSLQPPELQPKAQRQGGCFWLSKRISACVSTKAFHVFWDVGVQLKALLYSALICLYLPLHGNVHCTEWKTSAQAITFDPVDAGLVQELCRPHVPVEISTLVGVFLACIVVNQLVFLMCVCLRHFGLGLLRRHSVFLVVTASGLITLVCVAALLKWAVIGYFLGLLADGPIYEFDCGLERPCVAYNITVNMSSLGQHQADICAQVAFPEDCNRTLYCSDLCVAPTGNSASEVITLMTR